MKVYLRDRITAGVSAGVLLVLVASSYYYSIRTEIEANQAFIDRDAPDFIAHNISVTEFKDDGSADRRLFAEYTEHYADGRMSSIKPRMVTLSADKPQVRATSDSGQSMDGGETFTFNGNVLVTRATTPRCALPRPLPRSTPTRAGSRRARRSCSSTAPTSPRASASRLTMWTEQ